VELFPTHNKKKLSFLQEGILMGRTLSGWAIIAGCFLMFLGLCFLPAALGRHRDDAILGAGICVFAVGTLISAAGLYLKALVLQSAATLPGGAKPQPKQIRGGCDLCGTESPVIHCRVHQLHLCGNCVAKHYDFRSCVYVPSTRRNAPAKAVAKFAAKA
jgi:hypothetical protein